MTVTGVWINKERKKCTISTRWMNWINLLKTVWFYEKIGVYLNTLTGFGLWQRLAKMHVNQRFYAINFRFHFFWMVSTRLSVAKVLPSVKSISFCKYHNSVKVRYTSFLANVRWVDGEWKEGKNCTNSGMFCLLKIYIQSDDPFKV